MVALKSPVNVCVCLNGEDGVAPELRPRGTTRTRLQRQFVHGRLGGGSVRPAMSIILDKVSSLTQDRIKLSVEFYGLDKNLHPLVNNY